MRKIEIVEHVINNTTISRSQAIQAVDCAFDAIEKALCKGESVYIRGFGTIKTYITKEMTPFISGEFTVSDIKRANYSELFPCEEDSADRWFKCKLYFITSDEKSGAEKKTATNVLVQAADLRDAVNKLDEGMKGTMADYQIASVAETAIMDVYPYAADESITDTISENANSPVVRNFIQSLPEGCRTTITVGGKKVVVDKTGKDTIVTPEKQSDNDT